MARVAETLSPFSAAARIVAEVAAVGVELRRLSLAGEQIEAAKVQALRRLENRRIDADQVIYDMHRTVTATEVNAREMREMIAAARNAIFQRNVPAADKEIYREILDKYAARLIENHLGGGNILTDQIDKVLNGDGALGPDQPRRSSPEPQRRGGSRNRNRRP